MDDATVRVQVEGRLVDRAADDLHGECDPDLAAGRLLLIDLSSLSFLDRTGRDALRALERRGALLVGQTPFVSELLRSGSDQSPASVAAEDELLEGLRAGDDEAFATLVRLHAGRMLATARRLLRSEDEARDAVQEAFVSAFSAMDRFDGRARLSTWLHRIVVNSALMRLRRQRRRPEESIDDLLPRFADDGHWETAPSPWTDTTEDRLERQAARARVRACIDRLPETHRTVLLLRDIDELDTQEAADALGITPNAVKVRLHRARQALRTLLEPDLARRVPAAARAIPA